MASSAPIDRGEERPAPFNVTRLSHVVLTVRDLGLSRQFYEEVVGLSVVDCEQTTLYLRGVEERCHHSLVLEQRDTAPACKRFAFRVATDDELLVAKDVFDRTGRPATWVEVPYQGLTLLVEDGAGAPVEFCAGMPADGRRTIRFDLARGAAPARIDHIQVHVSDIAAAWRFYRELGFRVSEFASRDGTLDSPIRSLFLARKGNANDIVLLSNQGPRLHHVAFVVHDAATSLMHACDVAASLGLGDSIEWGPGRHGLGTERFLYLRDPDGHRVELLSHPYQLIDLEDETYGWSTTSPDVAHLWGQAAPASWRDDASMFASVSTSFPRDAAWPAEASPQVTT